MNIIEIFLAVALIHIPVLLTPGADVVLVMSYGMLRSRKEARLVALGITIGSCVMVGISLLCIGVIKHLSDAAFLVLKMLGAMYLLYLAYVTHRSTKTAMHFAANKKLISSHRHPVITGIFIEITNPKTIWFFVTVFAVVSKVDSSTPGLLFAGMIIVILTGIYYFLLAHISSGKRVASWANEHSKTVSVIAIVAFIAAALRLLV